jgi:hypothetical protein
VTVQASGKESGSSPVAEGQDSDRHGSSGKVELVVITSLLLRISDVDFMPYFSPDRKLAASSLDRSTMIIWKHKLQHPFKVQRAGCEGYYNDGNMARFLFVSVVTVRRGNNATFSRQRSCGRNER